MAKDKGSDDWIGDLTLLVLVLLFGLIKKIVGGIIWLVRWMLADLFRIGVPEFPLIL